MNARHQTFADLSRPLASLSHDQRNTLTTAWRYSLREVEDHLLFIPQHMRTVADPHQRPAYVRQCQEQLARRLPRYAAAVRRVSEYEREMDLAGIPYSRSSHDWRA